MSRVSLDITFLGATYADGFLSGVEIAPLDGLACWSVGVVMMWQVRRRGVLGNSGDNNEQTANCCPRAGQEVLLVEVC